MEYRESYGGSSIRPGTPPDFTRCAAPVAGGAWESSRQCKNTAKYDPDENGNPTTCRRHRDKQQLADSQPPVRIEAAMKSFTMYEATAACPECDFVARSRTDHAEWSETAALNELSAHVRRVHHRNIDRVARHGEQDRIPATTRRRHHERDCETAL